MGPDNEIGTEGERTDAVAPSALQVAGTERTDELAKAYEELKRAQAELQRPVLRHGGCVHGLSGSGA
jgi:hypothetical protein